MSPRTLNTTLRYASAYRIVVMGPLLKSWLEPLDAVTFDDNGGVDRMDQTFGDIIKEWKSHYTIDDALHLVYISAEFASWIFGKNRDKGIRLCGMEPEVVELGKGITEDDLLFHDEKSPEPSLAYLLSRMRYEDGFPEPIGVFRCVDAPRYHDMVNLQIEESVKEKGQADLAALFHSGETWTVQ